MVPVEKELCAQMREACREQCRKEINALNERLTKGAKTFVEHQVKLQNLKERDEAHDDSINKGDTTLHGRVDRLEDQFNGFRNMMFVLLGGMLVNIVLTLLTNGG